MQKRIYRFEIVRGVSNAVYLVNDTARGTSATLYEWTPDARELDRCLTVLNGLTTSGEYELFSSGASLYLAAATAQAGEAGLRRLREAGLFKGNFAGVGLAIPPPPPPILEPLKKPVEKGKTVMRALLVVSATMIVTALLLGLAKC